MEDSQLESESRTFLGGERVGHPRLGTGTILCQRGDGAVVIRFAGQQRNDVIAPLLLRPTGMAAHRDSTTCAQRPVLLSSTRSDRAKLETSERIAARAASLRISEQGSVCYR